MHDRDWLASAIETPEQFSALERELIDDLSRQLEEHGLKLMKTAYMPFRFSAVAENGDETKWLHILTDDMREGPQWIDAVSLRRMSSPTDWKGKVFHHCHWDAIGQTASELFDDKYDFEML